MPDIYPELMPADVVVEFDGDAHADFTAGSWPPDSSLAPGIRFDCVCDFDADVPDENVPPDVEPTPPPDPGEPPPPITPTRQASPFSKKDWVRRVSIVMPDPELDSKGRPVG